MTLSTSHGKSEFLVPDHSNWDTLISESHYYKWLQDNAKIGVHFINDKKAYLKSIGYDSENHILNQRDIELLRIIETKMGDVLWDARLNSERGIS